jgi:hypothetical protein
MSSSNLFLALRSSAPRPGRDAIEDYTTEAFRWLLDANPGLGSSYVTWLLEQAGRQAKVPELSWKTQLQLGAGRVDLVGIAADESMVIVCEHKVWAPLEPGQLDRYRSSATEKWGADRVLTVLVTGSQGQHSQHADAALTWYEVHGFLESWLERHRNDSLMVEDFMDYLDGTGLGPKLPIDAKMLPWFAEARTLPRRLRAMFDQVAAELDLGWLAGPCRSLGKKETTRPTSMGARWGRVGLEFPSEPRWRPGVFVGVLFDGSAHHVELSRPEQGPDFVLILNYDPEAGEPSQEKFLKSSEFEQLRTRLRTEASDKWDFHDHLNEAKGTPNRNHPIHLRRSLVSVLEGAENVDEQRQAVIAAVVEVTDLLFSGDEIARFVSPLE